MKNSGGSDFIRRIKNMKKISFVISIAIVCVMMMSSLCVARERYLIVDPTPSKKEDISKIEEVKMSLVTGGYITIDVDLCRQIEKEFDKKYTPRTGSFYIIPAILNMIGDNDWNLHSVQTGGKYLFVKSSKIF